MAYSKTRRFVAGAVCPKCSSMDKIVVYNEDGRDYRECVTCNYKDEMRFEQQPRALETRVNTTEDEIAAQTQVIQFPPLDD
jgi:hypothetical protein